MLVEKKISTNPKSRRDDICFFKGIYSSKCCVPTARYFAWGTSISTNIKSLTGLKAKNIDY
jgi:hypothetical protein